jgi:hypothetical protein
MAHATSGVRDSGRTEHSPIAFNFVGRTERLGVIVGELDRGPAFDGRDFADQADGIKPLPPAGIASPEIVGQQSAPAGAETESGGQASTFADPESRRRCGNLR